MTTLQFTAYDERLLSKEERKLPDRQKAVLVKMRRAVPIAQTMDNFFSEFIDAHDSATYRAVMTELALNFRAWLYAGEKGVSPFKTWLLHLLADTDFKYEDYFVPDGKLAEFMLDAMDEDEERESTLQSKHNPELH